MNRIYLIAALSLLSLTAYADNSTLAGNYQCQRTDSSNNSTSYPLSIKDNAGTYTFEWDNTHGYPAMYGTGIMHPSMSNLVTVSFLDATNADNYGVELFEIKPDGSLQSNWAVQSANQIGSATCTKSK